MATMGFEQGISDIQQRPGLARELLAMHLVLALTPDAQQQLAKGRFAEVPTEAQGLYSKLKVKVTAGGVMVTDGQGDSAHVLKVIKLQENKTVVILDKVLFSGEALKMRLYCSMQKLCHMCVATASRATGARTPVQLVPASWHCCCIPHEHFNATASLPKGAYSTIPRRFGANLSAHVDFTVLMPQSVSGRYYTSFARLCNHRPLISDMCSALFKAGVLHSLATNDFANTVFVPGGWAGTYSICLLYDLHVLCCAE
jgi:hypothetical protein